MRFKKRFCLFQVFSLLLQQGDTETCASRVKPVSIYNKASGKYLRIYNKNRVVADEENKCKPNLICGFKIFFNYYFVVITDVLYMVTLGTEINYPYRIAPPEFLLYDPTERRFICVKNKVKNRKPKKLFGRVSWFLLIV